MKTTSTLLIDGPVLTVQADLAVAIGLEQAIIIQQLHWWLRQRRNARDGRYWVYNTYEDWHKQFPFIAVRSLKRIITQMEADGLLLSSNYNAHKVDRTKWYTINYDHPALDPADETRRPSGQTGTMTDPSGIDVDSAEMDRSVPKGTKEATTKEGIPTPTEQQIDWKRTQLRRLVGDLEERRMYLHIAQVRETPGQILAALESAHYNLTRERRR
jgi:hypothetical protein